MNKHTRRLLEAADDDDPLDDEDAIDNLMSLLRRYIRSAGYEDPHVSFDGEAICIQFIMSQGVPIASLMKVMGLLHKIHNDILIEYECEFDVAETTKDEPLLTALFHMTPGQRGVRREDGDTEYYSGDAPFDMF